MSVKVVMLVKRMNMLLAQLARFRAVDVTFSV